MTETDNGRLIALMTGYKDEIKADFRLYLGIPTESILRQLDLVIEANGGSWKKWTVADGAGAEDRMRKAPARHRHRSQGPPCRYRAHHALYGSRNRSPESRGGL
jgi:hypothetical protein